MVKKEEIECFTASFTANSLIASGANVMNWKLDDG